MACPSERAQRAAAVCVRAAAVAAEYDERSVSSGEVRSLANAIGSLAKGLCKLDDGFVDLCESEA